MFIVFSNHWIDLYFRKLFLQKMASSLSRLNHDLLFCSSDPNSHVSCCHHSVFVLIFRAIFHISSLLQIHCQLKPNLVWIFIKWSSTKCWVKIKDCYHYKSNFSIRNLFKEIIFSAQSKLYMNDSWKNLSKHNKRMTTNTYLSTLTGGRGSFLVIGKC